VSALITTGQLKRLQTLYGQLCAHTIEPSSREARIAWAAGLVGRKLSSFSDLTGDEARRLIDGLQAQLGVRMPPRKRMERRAAARHAKDGRRDGAEFASAPEMVSAEDLAAIQQMYERLGWTRERFDAWLRSPTSPIRKTDTAIRSTSDANRVRWALKGMLRNRGLWEDRKPA
jgi:hypothetical protein